MQRCNKCHETKPLSIEHFEWYAAKRRYRPTCKPCKNIQRRAWYRSNPEKARAYQVRSYSKHADKFRAASKERRRQKPEECRAYTKAWYAALKAEMFSAYGNRCACCGETERRFLTLEHSRRDGGEHRRKLGGQSQIYSDLKRQGWPTDGYELLCWNCQMATRYGEPCPHRLRNLIKAVA
jgi:hypothetical protein